MADLSTGTSGSFPSTADFLASALTMLHNLVLDSVSDLEVPDKINRFTGLVRLECNGLNTGCMVFYQLQLPALEELILIADSHTADCLAGCLAKDSFSSLGALQYEQEVIAVLLGIPPRELVGSEGLDFMIYPCLQQN